MQDSPGFLPPTAEQTTEYLEEMVAHYLDAPERFAAELTRLLVANDLPAHELEPEDLDALLHPKALLNHLLKFLSAQQVASPAPAVSAVSVRVVRWDTGQEAEIPKEALRWGPDTRQGTCRAQLLRDSRLGSGGVVPLLGEVPYVLPFEGAKWAVRVTLAERESWASSLSRLGGFRADDPRWIGSGWRGFLVDPPYRAATAPEPAWKSPGIGCALLDPAGQEKLRSLLEAAGDALRAEVEGDRPDALGEALELLNSVMDGYVRVDLKPKIAAFLERETSAEIRRARRGSRG